MLLLCLTSFCLCVCTASIHNLRFTHILLFIKCFLLISFVLDRTFRKRCRMKYSSNRDLDQAVNSSAVCAHDNFNCISGPSKISDQPSRARRLIWTMTERNCLRMPFLTIRFIFIWHISFVKTHRCSEREKVSSQCKFLQCHWSVYRWVLQGSAKQVPSTLLYRHSM